MMMLKREVWSVCAVSRVARLPRPLSGCSSAATDDVVTGVGYYVPHSCRKLSWFGFGTCLLFSEFCEYVRFGLRWAAYVSRGGGGDSQPLPFATLRVNCRLRVVGF